MKIKQVIVFASIAAAFLLNVCFAQDSTASLPGFRDFKWGVSIKEVREKEKAEYMQHFSGFGIEALSYKSEVAEISARVDFTFRKGVLVEGSYAVTPDNSFVKNFSRLLEYIFQKYGKARFRIGPNYTLDSIWVKENDYGLFKGPALYWVFKNGFIALHSQRFKDNITITLLYSSEKIEDYSSKNLLQLKDFNIRLE